MPEEDFDIESLAAYLHLAPEQVQRMANRDKLPGRRVRGEWRFSRAEIHHWLEDRIGLSDENELLKVEQTLDRQSSATDEILVRDFLTAQRICLSLAARTKNSVIDEICQFSAQSGALWMPKDMADAVRQREALHPTALDSGVALLHPRRPKPAFFGEPFLTLAVTSGGIPFGGPRGILTDIFFLIASADDAFHLKILARLSRLIQSTGLLSGIRTASEPHQAWQLIADAEHAM